tara:strand:+ start:951 stop:1160 length:210 start_codon:yes stop_codon:yes gene_type:complete
VLIMAKGMLHFTKDGKFYKREVHKMPDGSIHSGKTHNKSSKKVYHFKELSTTAKNKAGKAMSIAMAKKK